MLKESGSNTKYTVEEIKAILTLVDKDIKLLSTEYVNANSYLDFECQVCEHPYKKKWSAVTNRKEGCPVCGKNGVKISKKDIEKLVERENYKIVRFLEGDNRGGSRFTIQCARRHVYDTTYRKFTAEESKGAGSCKQCNKEGFSRGFRLRHKELARELEELGYAIKNGEPIKKERDKRVFVCINGHERNTSFNVIKECPRCAQCEGRVVKHTEKSLSVILKEIGLSYIGGFTSTSNSFTYKCECGTEDTGYLHDLRSGIRCYKCSNRKFWNYSEVKQFFKENSCTLLEDVYVDSRTPLKFVCSCTKEAFKSFGEYQLRPFCKECGRYNKPRGENHPMWNPNKTEEERMDDRKYPEYKEWRISVFERDNYKCQCCGDDRGGNLEAHHIFNYTEHKELRLELSNGITLCDIDCHKRFHDIYGYTNNNDKQLEEFIEMRQKEQEQKEDLYVNQKATTETNQTIPYSIPT